MAWAEVAPLTGWRLMGDKWETLSMWSTGKATHCGISGPLSLRRLFTHCSHTNTRQDCAGSKNASATHTYTQVKWFVFAHSNDRIFLQRKTALLHPHLQLLINPSKSKESQTLKCERVKSKQLHSDVNKHRLLPSFPLLMTCLLIRLPQSSLSSGS